MEGKSVVLQPSARKVAKTYVLNPLHLAVGGTPHPLAVQGAVTLFTRVPPGDTTAPKPPTPPLEATLRAASQNIPVQWVIRHPRQLAVMAAAQAQMGQQNAEAARERAREVDMGPAVEKARAAVVGVLGREGVAVRGVGTSVTSVTGAGDTGDTAIREAAQGLVYGESSVKNEAGGRGLGYGLGEVHAGVQTAVAAAVGGVAGGVGRGGLGGVVVKQEAGSALAGHNAAGESVRALVKQEQNGEGGETEMTREGGSRVQQGGEGQVSGQVLQFEPSTAVVTSGTTGRPLVTITPSGKQDYYTPGYYLVTTVYPGVPLNAVLAAFQGLGWHTFVIKHQQQTVPLPDIQAEPSAAAAAAGGGGGAAAAVAAGVGPAGATADPHRFWGGDGDRYFMTQAVRWAGDRRYSSTMAAINSLELHSIASGPQIPLRDVCEAITQENEQNTEKLQRKWERQEQNGFGVNSSSPSGRAAAAAAVVGAAEVAAWAEERYEVQITTGGRPGTFDGVTTLFEVRRVRRSARMQLPAAAGGAGVSDVPAAARGGIPTVTRTAAGGTPVMLEEAAVATAVSTAAATVSSAAVALSGAAAAVSAAAGTPTVPEAVATAVSTAATTVSSAAASLSAMAAAVSAAAETAAADDGGSDGVIAKALLSYQKMDGTVKRIGPCLENIEVKGEWRGRGVARRLLQVGGF